MKTNKPSSEHPVLTIAAGAMSLAIGVLLSSCQPGFSTIVKRVDFPSDRRSAGVKVAGEASDPTSAVNGPRARALQPAACLWLTPQDSAVLSWEAVTTEELTSGCPNIPAQGCIGDAPSNPTPLHIAQCSLTNLDSPDGRVWGRRIVSPPTVTLIGGGFSRCALFDYRPWQFFGTCVDQPWFYQACSDPGANACGAQGANRQSNHPYCGQNCEPSITQDGAFAFRYPDGVETDAKAEGDRMFVSPYYFSVATSRVFRPFMKKISDGEGGQSGAASYVWKTRVPPEGSLLENFSPSLFISRVRAFDCRVTDLDETKLHYFKLVGLGINRHEVPSCTVEDGDPTTISAAGCRTLLTATPTHAGQDVDALGQIVEWRVDLQPDTPDGNPGLNSASAVCAEFHVNNLQSDVIPQIDFPNPANLIPGGPPAVIPRAGRIQLDGGGGTAWNIESVALVNASPGISVTPELAVPPSPSNPFRLQAGASLYLDATVGRVPRGQKQATVSVVMRRPIDPQSTTIQKQFSVWILEPAAMSLLPNPRRFPTTTNAAPFKHVLALINQGASPFTLRTIGIQGGADSNGRPQFHIERLTLNTPDMVFPPAVIDSGASMTIEVSYCPTELDRPLSASLSVTGDDSSGGPLITLTSTLTGDSIPSYLAACVVPRPDDRPPSSRKGGRNR